MGDRKKIMATDPIFESAAMANVNLMPHLSFGQSIKRGREEANGKVVNAVQERNGTPEGITAVLLCPYRCPSVGF